MVSWSLNRSHTLSSSSTVSPWDAGRAKSAWCWWRVWAEPPSCFWISCLRCPTGTTGPCLPSGGKKKERMVQFGSCCRRNKGNESHTETPLSVTMVTEFELTLLDTTLKKITILITEKNCRTSWLCGHRRGSEVRSQFGASSMTETVKGQRPDKSYTWRWIREEN